MGSKGLKGVKGGYWRFRWGYKGLQLVTRGYTRLQKVIGGYRGLKDDARGDRG